MIEAVELIFLRNLVNLGSHTRNNFIPNNAAKMNGKLQHIDRVIVMNMKMLLKILNMMKAEAKKYHMKLQSIFYT
jgi:hypothetical protein